MRLSSVTPECSISTIPPYLQLQDYTPTLSYKPLPMATQTKKAMSKELGWNDRELPVLSHAASQVCQNPAAEKSLKRRKMGEKLWEDFIAYLLRPNDACTLEPSKNYCDKFCWNARTPEACHEKSIAMRRHLVDSMGSSKVWCRFNWLITLERRISTAWLETNLVRRSTKSDFSTTLAITRNASSQTSLNLTTSKSPGRKEQPGVWHCL